MFPKCFWNGVLTGQGVPSFNAMSWYPTLTNAGDRKTSSHPTMHVVLLLDLWGACQARTRKIQMKKDEDDTICAKADTKNIWAYIISHKLWLRFLLSVMLADGIVRIPHSIRSCTALLSQISLSYTVILGWKQSRTVFATGFRTRRTDCSSQAGFQAQADCTCLTSNRFRVWLYCFRVSPKKHFF